MLSRRNIWLLLAIPIALVLLWASRSASAPSEAKPTAIADISGHLLYLAPANEFADLYAYDFISQQPLRLTQGAQISAFHISANGEIIYYAARNEAGGADIWQLQLNDRSKSLLIDCGNATCDTPQANFNGHYLAYQRQDSSSPLPQIWLHDFESTIESQISLEGQGAIQPQWALDGRLSYYNETVDTYEIFLPGSEIRVRTPNALGDPLSWRPDGASFVASEAFPATSGILRGSSGEASLQTPDPDFQSSVEFTITTLILYSGSSRQDLFEQGDELIEDAAPIFSPDGRWLAFTRKYLDEERWSPGRQLWLLHIEDGELIQLSNEASYQYSNPAWNDDSSQIAFVRSNRTDFNQPTELWAMQRDGSSSLLIAVDAFAPYWLP